jgi:hypothetical protein
MRRPYRANRYPDWIVAIGLAYAMWLRMRRWVRHLVHGSGRVWWEMPDDSKRSIE